MSATADTKAAETATPPTATAVNVHKARTALRVAMDQVDGARGRSIRASMDAFDRANDLRDAELREAAAFDDLAAAIAVKRREAAQP